MAKKPNKKPTSSADGTGSGKAKSTLDAGFDRWLEDKLRNVYSSVLDEPIPTDLIKLVQAKLKD